MHSSTPTLITDRHPHYPRSNIRTLLTLLSVFSPQSRNELKRAVDDCQSVPGWAPTCRQWMSWKFCHCATRWLVHFVELRIPMETPIELFPTVSNALKRTPKSKEQAVWIKVLILTHWLRAQAVYSWLWCVLIGWGCLDFILCYNYYC